MALFALWAVLVSDRFGGEPGAVVSADASKKSQQVRDPAAPPGREITIDTGQPSASTPGTPGAAPNTITIIDGMSGKRQEVVIGPGQQAPGQPPATTPQPAPARNRPPPATSRSTLAAWKRAGTVLFRRSPATARGRPTPMHGPANLAPSPTGCALPSWSPGSASAQAAPPRPSPSSPSPSRWR